MTFTKGTCENCGSALDFTKAVNNSVTCSFCGTPYFINQDMLTNIYEQKIKNADTFIKLGEYSKAKEIYLELLDKNAEDIRLYEGLFLVTDNLDWYLKMIKLNPEMANKYRADYDKVCESLVAEEKLCKKKRRIIKLKKILYPIIKLASFLLSVFLLLVLAPIINEWFLLALPVAGGLVAIVCLTLVVRDSVVSDLNDRISFNSYQLSIKKEIDNYISKVIEK